MSNQDRGIRRWWRSASTGEGVRFVMSFGENWEAEVSGFVQTTPFVLGETFFLGSRHEKGPYMVVAELLL